MDQAGDELRLDGNAAAGLLREIFSYDVTRAPAVCDGCGLCSAVGELLLYGHEMGAVLRCPGCQHVLMCLTKVHGVMWLDLRGTRVLRLAVDSS
jgi:hypothetical protein